MFVKNVFCNSDEEKDIVCEYLYSMSFFDIVSSIKSFPAMDLLKKK